jgi:peptidoglycan/xylan/chitin deacetylase (PgdA/CDA1 family)
VALLVLLLSANIASAAPALAVTSPNGGETVTQGTLTDVTWSLPVAVDVGSFDVWAWSPSTSWFQLNSSPVAAVPGRKDYSFAWSVVQPLASDYKLRVWYRDAGGNGVVMDDSNATFTIAVPGLAVTAPNGGESLAVGTTPDVTWSLPVAVDAGSFDVWAWSPSTSWYKLNDSPVAAVSGRKDYSFAWTVAQPLAGNYKLRVWYRDIYGNGVVMDDSNAVFAIVAPPPLALAVSTPNGGESVGLGTQKSIGWSINYAVGVGSFDVYVWGPTHSAVKLNAVPIVAGLGQTQFSFSWTVTQARATDWYARVVYRDGQGTFVMQDDSNAAFSIVTPQLAVTAPNGGEHLVVGASSNVTWTLPVALAVGSFDVQAVSPTQGTHALNSSPIAAEAGKTSYSLPWSVKEPLAADYTLHLVYRDGGAQQVASDDSDAVFSIVAPVPNVTAPNGGESLTAGAATAVTWTVDHALSAGSFDIQAVSPTQGTHTLNSGPIAVDPAKTDYTFAWTPALPLAGDYTLHLVYRDGQGQQRASDDSNATFSIVAPVVSVTAPNGGESLDFGVGTTATWSVDHALSAGSFDLQAVSPTKGTHTLNGSPIAADPAKTDYSFAWTVAQLPAADYKLRVVYKDGSAQQIASDDSNAAFSIVAPSLGVTAPNGGEQLGFNHGTTVTWSIGHKVSVGSFDVVAMSATRGDRTLNSSPIAVDPAKTDYSFAWTVAQLPATDYRIRVIYRDGSAQQVASDDSNAAFSIVAAVTTVTAPNGGEKLGTGTQTTVTWTMGEAVSAGSFDLEAVSTSQGTHKINGSPIAVDPAKTDYSFVWTVAQPPAADYKLRVVYRDVAAQEVSSDSSDAVFTIDPAHARDLVAVGKYEYVADGLSGLKIYDVSNPSAPTKVGACDTPGTAQGVSVQGDYAYVADGSAGMQVVDVTDPAHPTIVKTLAMPQPAKKVALSAGAVLQDFDSTSGWTVSNGTMSVDTTHVKHGAASLKVVAAAGTTAQINATGLNWDLSKENRGIQMWVYLKSTGITSTTPSDSLSLKLYLSNDIYLNDYFRAHNSIDVHEGWNLLHWAPLANSDPDWVASGSNPSWSRPIQRMTIEVQAPASRGYEASFDDFRVGVTGIKPAFLWTFDDGYEENYTDLFPYLESHGQKASMFVIGSWPSNPQAGSKISLDHLHALYNAGWAIGNHTYNHVDLSTVDQATAASEIQLGRDWLDSNGFTRTADFLAYPFNDTSQSAIAAAAESGVVAARQEGSRNQYQPMDEALQLSAWAVPDDVMMDVDAWKGRIDRAIANGGTIIVNAHRFNQTNTPLTAFQGVVDYLAAKHVWVPAIDEWWNTLVAQGETGTTSAGHYVYVACGTAGVQIVDVADPLNPVIVGARSTGNSANDVAADDTRVAVANSLGGLQMLDASNPAAPTTLGDSFTAGDAKGIAVRGGYAFLADGSTGLRIVSLADPANPAQVGACDTPNDARGLALVGHYAYVADGNSTIQVVDVADVANPQVVGTMSITGQAEAIEAWGGRAYVAAGDGGLQVVPLATP